MTELEELKERGSDTGSPEPLSPKRRHLVALLVKGATRGRPLMIGTDVSLLAFALIFFFISFWSGLSTVSLTLSAVIAAAVSTLTTPVVLILLTIIAGRTALRDVREEEEEPPATVF